MQIDNNMMLEELTGLPFPEFFAKKAKVLIEKELVRPAMISLDISNFKHFNEMYGFAEGDLLIHKCVDWFCHNNSDCILAQRTYIDHIVILLDVKDSDESDVACLYDKMNREFSNRINKAYPLSRIRIYSGIYVIDNRTENIAAMIDKAQYARRSIKLDYDKTVAIFVEDMLKKAKMESNVIPMFLSALEEGRIKVYLQPKFSIDKHELIGAEALSRIESVDGKIIPPGMYIDVLEYSGLIAKLDYYIIRKVIELQKQWLLEGRPITSISVNLSRMDFWEPGLIELIDNDIQQSGVPTEYFEFELTETVFCEDVAEITNKIKFLRSRGYKISMDDFGSGYNSLHMLGRVPVDIIKFDRGFVLNSIPVEAGRKVMTSLVNTFREINFEVICEGVESAEEEKIIHDCGCNAVQGFFHEKPLPSEVFADKYL